DPDVPPDLASVGGKNNDPARLLALLPARVWLPIRRGELKFGQPPFQLFFGVPQCRMVNSVGYHRHSPTPRASRSGRSNRRRPPLTAVLYQRSLLALARYT